MIDLQYADYTKGTKETYLFFGKLRYLMHYQCILELFYSTYSMRHFKRV